MPTFRLSEIGTRAKRLFVLTLCTFTGIGVGVSGDFATPHDPIAVGEVVDAILLSPIVVTFGGGGAGMRGAFVYVVFFAGLLFWPVYVGLAWLWVRKGWKWIALAILLWSAQGFFRVVHRMALVMSA